ncbi:MAG: glycosyltransferase family 9 protein [Gammaproteobacteria bacterium]|nr:glycosyltransferase family 9 protein [Gammaproteobacteria bacterium]NIR28880.1 glycosyltransferase family 9 protein [Gammaproteobacteria bacterium]NIR97276.1 glycosyltransferase family 9 protein [Gammaproteobacteria bacterium]NIT62976.1 glycosyltransferase family 9 protein [Gammaproteobacteria bacterium]NIV19935.1 glycosyl transferase family 1 [Gammaproteobacteria bacterium]
MRSLSGNRSARRAGPGGATLVVQPLPGIGDMVWHLPHLHALAAASPGGRLSILAKPRSQADRLLRGDPAIDRVLWVRRNPGPHDGVRGFFRLVALIRGGGFRRIWVLHDSSRYLLAALLAGVPERSGYGKGLQRFLQTSPVRLPRDGPGHPFDKAHRLLALHGLDPGRYEPRLYVGQAARARVTARYARAPRPWIAFGIGGSEASKRWGQARFAELARRACGLAGASVMLVGGPGEALAARGIAAKAGGEPCRVFTATDLAIDETAALLSQCCLYVGNDTGALNVAAAVGVEALGLFGGSPPLVHSPHIHALVPPDGARAHGGEGGMTDITVDAVLARMGELLQASILHGRPTDDTAPGTG